jgi:hypothetical protein
MWCCRGDPGNDRNGDVIAIAHDRLSMVGLSVMMKNR